MAETKRYYWIKLKEDFFQDDAISWIEEQKDGSYIFYYAGFTDTVSKEDVESGMYGGYSIIKYNKK